MRAQRLVALLVALLCVSCANGGSKKQIELKPVLGEKNPRSPDAEIEKIGAGQSEAIAIVGATILLGTGQRIEDGTVVFEGGRLKAIGTVKDVKTEGVRMIDGRGKFVTPGLIDTHSHLGVYASPSTFATEEGNEMTDPTTPYAFSEYGFWPQDAGLRHAVGGGITTLQILPGSANVIGGRSVTLHVTPHRSARAMRFPNAPFGLKMACGENPRRVYGGKNRAPMTRMGNIQQLRDSFIKAQAYRHARAAFDQERTEWQRKYDAAKASTDTVDDPGKEPYGPDRDIGRETLADVLDGKIKVHIHCYRADEMLQMIALSKELGFKISSFHHAVEAYKIADVLASEDIAASLWADWWGFKLEAYDGIEENVPMLAAAGGRPIVHSDSATGIQRLNQEASKALHAGIRAGLKVNEDMAIQWVTQNPAIALGIDDQTGTLTQGKLADVVIWNANPLSIYARAEKVFVSGELVFDREGPQKAWSDFDVGTDVEEVLP